MFLLIICYSIYIDVKYRSSIFNFVLDLRLVRVRRCNVVDEGLILNTALSRNGDMCSRRGKLA